MTLSFEKINLQHIDIIFDWLAEPFVQEFWDNTQGHKDDILNFVHGRIEPSNYCDGKYVYWIASCDGHPFAMLMTIQETAEDHIDDIKLNHLSKTGHTYGIDYMIGNRNYFGKGYGAKTLSEFLDFFIKNVDPTADTFMIDPASDNPRAKHVYIKAGFEHIADFLMSGDVSGAGKPHHLLIKHFYERAKPYESKTACDLLNKLSDEINNLYGYVEIAGDNFGEPAINSGPCAPFANTFFKLWNQEFTEKVTIVFIMVKNSDECWHTLIRLPNGLLFDGGHGVHTEEIYKDKFDVLDMLVYDIELLEKNSYGLNRQYPRYCPNFSIEVITDLIQKYLKIIKLNA